MLGFAVKMLGKTETNSLPPAKMVHPNFGSRIGGLLPHQFSGLVLLFPGGNTLQLVIEFRMVYNGSKN